MSLFSLIPAHDTSGRHRRLAALNRQINRYHLSLSPGEIAMLMDANDHALENTGRVELEHSLPEALVTAFCDSPLLHQEIFAATICGLTELFYHLKNETDDLIPDDELILLMRRRFDDPCKGSVEMLADLLGRGLY